MLQRNLIYTALTRAKNLAVVVGTRRALAIGVRNDTIEKRYTGLRDRLR
jgi:exodeoxyribonuclease V alpha subunit